MKIERKVYAFIISMILLGVVIGSIYANRTITYNSDDIYTKIINSDGEVFPATWTGLKDAIDNITSAGWIKLGPAITYTVSSTITVTNKSIMIYGNNALIDLSSYNGLAFHFQSTGARSYYACGIKDVRIIGDDTDASSVFVNFTSVIGLLENCQTINGNRIRKFVDVYYGCNGTRIVNNAVTVHYAVRIVGVSYEPYGVVVSNNHFDSKYVSGVDPMGEGCKINNGRACIVSDNTFKDYVWGINASQNYGVRITNNYVNGMDCIYSYSQFPTISDNFLMCDYLNSDGIVVYQTLYGGTISGNTIWSYQNTGFKGISFSGTCRRFSITGNTIIQEQTPTGTYGIYSASTCTNFTIVGNALNNLDSLTGTAIYFTSLSGSTVVGNAITNWSTEMSITGTGNEVAHNT